MLFGAMHLWWLPGASFSFSLLIFSYVFALFYLILFPFSRFHGAAHVLKGVFVKCHV